MPRLPPGAFAWMLNPFGADTLGTPAAPRSAWQPAIDVVDAVQYVTTPPGASSRVNPSPNGEGTNPSTPDASNSSSAGGRPVAIVCETPKAAVSTCFTAPVAP